MSWLDRQSFLGPESPQILSAMRIGIVGLGGGGSGSGLGSSGYLGVRIVGYRQAVGPTPRSSWTAPMTAGAAIRTAKLERIRRGGAPRVLELCSGCGGMSLGLKAAGFDLVAHVEMDATAAKSYALNFAPPVADRRDAWSAARDMTQSDPTTLCRELGLEGSAAEQFDVLAAGLPCQAFARIGRSKLRSVTGALCARPVLRKAAH